MTGTDNNNVYSDDGGAAAARRRKNERKNERKAGGGGVKQHKHRHKLKHRFQFVKTLGRGTYGKVKLATEIETGEQVAIKSIPKSKIENAEDLRRIRQEIQIMAALDHPHIINIKEVFESKDKIVLVMDYASGGELYDYINSDSLTPEEARRFFQQIVSAIYYCHKNNIVHRDLKLENVLLDDNHNVKIADFGLSSVFDHNNLLYTYCGSPLYASPEIVNGLPYHGPEVDCWSLGVLLYAMVYKTMPFLGGDFNELRQQISEGDYYEPSNPSDASDLIRWMLKVDPKRRATIEDIYHHTWVFGDTLDVPPPDVRGTRVLPVSSRLHQQIAADLDNLLCDNAEMNDSCSRDRKQQLKGILKNCGVDSGDNLSDSEEAQASCAPATVSPAVCLATTCSSSDIESQQPCDNDQVPAVTRRKHHHRGLLNENNYFGGTDSGLDINEHNDSINIDLLTVESLEKEFGIFPTTTTNKRDSGFDQDLSPLGAQASGFQELADVLDKKTLELSEKLSEVDLNSISKRQSKGKYSAVMEMWDSVFSSMSTMNDLEEPDRPVSGGSSSASSSEDLLDILDTPELKTKSETNPRRKPGHHHHHHPVSYRVYESSEVTTIKDGRVVHRSQGRRSSDTLLGMEDEVRDVLRRALKISESLM